MAKPASSRGKPTAPRVLRRGGSVGLRQRPDEDGRSGGVTLARDAAPALSPRECGASSDTGGEVAAVPVVPHSPQRWRRVSGMVAGPLAVLGVIIGIWYIIAYFVLDPSRQFLLPPPQTVVNTAFLQHDNLMVLLSGLGITAEVAMAGLAIAIVVGVSVAILMSEAKLIERGFYPYLVVLQTIPILALVPLIGFWIGFGFSARIVVCVLISIFPIIANTLFGLQSYSPTYKELFDLHRAGRLTRLLKLKLPMAMPATFAGFRISAGLSVIGEIVGGYFFQRGSPDLGALLDEFTARLNGPMLFGGIILAAMLGVAVFWVFGGISALVIGRWKE